MNQLNGKPFSQKYYELLEIRQSLPIWGYCTQFTTLLAQNQCIVLVGTTGSGKSTQVPQWCIPICQQISPNGSVVCTQPRRLAATSLAERVAEEADVLLGQHIGYAIRFENCSSEQTILKYCTDGLLLQELASDRMLSKYNIVLLDEAHERTLDTDLLLGLLKKLLTIRRDLKMVVMSATLDAQKFKNYFGKCPILTVQGRLHDVEIFYTPVTAGDFLSSAVQAVVQIHTCEEAGDILVFLTGQEMIEKACKAIDQRMLDLGDNFGILDCIPLYANLSTSEQNKIFASAPPSRANGAVGRKCIVSTNVAETSLTIDGIVYVIDLGFSKQLVYNPDIQLESLLSTPISKASANQRSGHAGRTRPGKCYRLYTEEAYQRQMRDETIPEILCGDFTPALLKLKTHEVHDVLHFDYIDPPAPLTMSTALETLMHLGAMDEEGVLTALGRIMAKLPVSPAQARALVASADLGCSNEVLSIIAVMATNLPVFLNPANKRTEAKLEKKSMIHTGGDHLTLLNVYHAYKQNNESLVWCRENFVNYKALKNADIIRYQLSLKLVECNIKIVSTDFESASYYTNIVKALLSGFFMQTAYRDVSGIYCTLSNHQCGTLHPSSVYGGVNQPQWVFYTEFVLTKENRIRMLSAIRPEWLIMVAPLYWDLDLFPDSPVKRALLDLNNE